MFARPEVTSGCGLSIKKRKKKMNNMRVNNKRGNVILSFNYTEVYKII